VHFDLEWMIYRLRRLLLCGLRRDKIAKASATATRTEATLPTRRRLRASAIGTSTKLSRTAIDIGTSTSRPKYRPAITATPIMIICSLSAPAEICAGTAERVSGLPFVDVRHMVYLWEGRTWVRRTWPPSGRWISVIRGPRRAVGVSGSPSAPSYSRSTAELRSARRFILRFVGLRFGGLQPRVR
jgi:hypothetical protein